jgi:hypothetical protein
MGELERCPECGGYGTVENDAYSITEECAECDGTGGVRSTGTERDGSRPATDDETESGPPWRVKYTAWEKSDDACGDRKSGHTGDQRTFEGFYFEETPVDCINAIVYDLRGVKSRWELAYIDEIEPAERDGGDR